MTERPLNAAEQVAEAPPDDPMHPAVIERLAEDAKAMARNLDAADARSMAADGPWSALQALAESLEHLVREVELHRPVTSLP